jgi:hypothetical protein
MSEFLNKKGSSNQSDTTSKMKSSSKANNKNDTGCRFCKNNGETEEVYMSHPLKDSLSKVVCPCLRAHVCKQCGKLESFLSAFYYYS